MFLHNYCVADGMQFEEMYEQKRKEVNKAAEKFEKQLKAAKRSGNKANTDKVLPNCSFAPVPADCFVCIDYGLVGTSQYMHAWTTTTILAMPA